MKDNPGQKLATVEHENKSQSPGQPEGVPANILKSPSMLEGNANTTNAPCKGYHSLEKVVS